MKRFVFLLPLAVLAITGCSTYATARYSISADNVAALRSINGNLVNVGQFTATTPDQSVIVCRGFGPIKTPDGETFADYIRKALFDEVRMANIYSPDAPITITGNLDVIDFSSVNGGWSITLTLSSSKGRSLTVSENYEFTSSFYGETACSQTAQAFMPAIQNLIGKIVHSPDFATMVTP